MNRLRVGYGFDVHRLVSGRRLVVGGIEIPFAKGLEGHSDADVLLHAIMDALLGAAGLGDIGMHFPPSDDQYLEADSLGLLCEVRAMLEEAGFNRIVNVDCTVIAERPRMRPYIGAMQETIAQALDIGASDVNVKATTVEKLGFVGREEGIAASAVCLVAADE